jgi:hypothetical protein
MRRVNCGGAVMECASRGSLGVVVCLVAAGSLQCSKAESPNATLGADTVLECRASEIHHVFRIRAAAQEVDDLAFTPVKSGVAEVSDAVYLLRFHEARDNYDLVLQIARSSGLGTRRLFDDEQQASRGTAVPTTLSVRRSQRFAESGRQLRMLPGSVRAWNDETC